MALYEIDIGGPDWEQRYRDEVFKRNVAEKTIIQLQEQINEIRWKQWLNMWDQIGKLFSYGYSSGLSNNLVSCSDVTFWNTTDIFSQEALESKWFWQEFAEGGDLQTELDKLFEEVDKAKPMTANEFTVWLHNLGTVQREVI